MPYEFYLKTYKQVLTLLSFNSETSFCGFFFVFPRVGLLFVGEFHLFSQVTS